MSSVQFKRKNRGNHQITKWAKILLKAFRRWRDYFQLGRLGAVIADKCELGVLPTGEGKAKGVGESGPFASARSLWKYFGLM